MPGLSTLVTTAGPAAPQGARTTDRRWWLVVVWLGGLIAGTGLFHALGSGQLAPPPLDLVGWSDWLADRDALIASVAVLRLVVLALSWYLVGATTIGLVARLARAARVVRVADALTVPFVRRLLHASLGLSLATTMVASAMSGGSVSASVADRTVTRSVPLSATELDDAETDAGAAIGSTGASGVDTRPVSDEQRDTVTLERNAPPRRPVPLDLLDRARDRVHVAVDDADEGRSAPGVVDERIGGHVVVAGDSLWSIAATALTGTDGRRPDVRAVAAYWRVVVDANRGGLTDPQNPDLIFPGEVIHLPERPA